MEDSIKSWSKWFGDKFDNNPHNFALASIGIFILLSMVIYFILADCFRDKLRAVLFGWIGFEEWNLPSKATAMIFKCNSWVHCSNIEVKYCQMLLIIYQYEITLSSENSEYNEIKIERGASKNIIPFCGAVHKLRYAIEVGGWSAKYNHCKF